MFMRKGDIGGDDWFQAGGDREPTRQNSAGNARPTEMVAPDLDATQPVPDRPGSGSRQPTDVATTTADGGDGGATASPAARRRKLLQQREAQLAKHKSKARMSGPLSPNPDLPRTTSAGPAPSRPSGFNSPPESRNSSTGASSTDSSIRDLIKEREMQKDARDLSAIERELLAQGIAPVFDPVEKKDQDVKLDFSDMRTFLTNPVPKGIVLQCQIVRNKKGWNNLYPHYDLCTKDDRFLLSAKKRSANKTSNYLVSMDRNDMDKTSASYLGKLRSNFVGTEFVLYDKGLNPKDVGPDALSVNMMTARQELAAVLYESNILGSRGPRRMTVLVPAIKDDGHRVVFRPANDDVLLVNKFKNGESNSMTVMVNKPPKWNDQVGAYVLNFNGRVTMASVKNFQLISDTDAETVLLQFGRVSKEKFTMDIQWPLSPLQAFGICLSSFDHKLACE